MNLSRKVKAALMAALFILTANGLSHPATAQSQLPSPPPLDSLFGGPFELVDHNGQTRTNKDFQDQHMLVYFGYTFCPDICPANLQHMSNALDALGDTGKNIQPLFISIDPGRDTPEILKEYMTNFHPRFLGLTGTFEQVVKAAKAHRVHARKVELADVPKDEYLVDHSSLTLFFGPNGKFLTLFPHNTTGEVMVQRMRQYLK